MYQNDCKIPTIDSIIKQLKGKYSKQEFLSFEHTVFFDILKCNANVTTSFDFSKEFLYRGILSGKEIGWKILSKEHSYELVNFFEKIVDLFVEFASKYYEFYFFKTSVVAASSIACARKIFGTD